MGQGGRGGIADVLNECPFSGGVHMCVWVVGGGKDVLIASRIQSCRSKRLCNRPIGDYSS